jgi:enamine deaminase RidA (YjgF/YER057c/UK114 family)
MRKKYLNPKQLSEPRFYSHAVAIEGSGTVINVSGQVAFNRDGAVVGKGDMRAQSEQVFENLSHALRAAVERLVHEDLLLEVEVTAVVAKKKKR